MTWWEDEIAASTAEATRLVGLRHAASATTDAAGTTADADDCGDGCGYPREWGRYDAALAEVVRRRDAIQTAAPTLRTLAEKIDAATVASAHAYQVWQQHATISRWLVRVIATGWLAALVIYLVWVALPRPADHPQTTDPRPLHSGWLLTALVVGLVVSVCVGLWRRHRWHVLGSIANDTSNDDVEAQTQLGELLDSIDAGHAVADTDTASSASQGGPRVRTI